MRLGKAQSVSVAFEDVSDLAARLCALDASGCVMAVGEKRPDGMFAELDESWCVVLAREGVECCNCASEMLRKA